MNQMINNTKKKSNSNIKMSLPKQFINLDKIGRVSQRAIKSIIGAKNKNDLIEIAKANFVKMPKNVKAQEIKAYKWGGNILNEVIQEERDKVVKEKKIKAVKLKAANKKKKNNVVLDFDSDNLLVSLNRMRHFYSGLAKVYKNGRNINVYKKRLGGGQELEFDGTLRIAFNYRFTNKMSNDFKVIFERYLQIDSETNRIDDDTDYQIHINIGEVISPNKMNQYFKQGTTNCFFKPIIEWAAEKVENSKSKATTNRYRAMYNKLIKDNDKYFDTGVTENDMNLLSNKYQINIEVNTPFQKEFIVVKSNKKALTSFKYINTKIDHIDHNKIVNLKCEEIDQKTLNDMGETLLEDNVYFTYKKNSFGYGKISTLEGSYIVKTDYHNCIQDFEKDTGLIDCYIDDLTEVDVSEFVRQGVHFNETIEFKDDLFYRPDDEGIDELDTTAVKDEYLNFNHMDMSKAYSNFHLSKYYKGFLGKPTDLRKCDHIVDVGYYQIENVNFENATPLLKAYNEKMMMYNDNVYPSPELDFLKDHNVTFDIIAGCWGMKTDFRFTDEMIKSKEKYPDEPSWYARYTGSMFCDNLYNNFYLRGDKKLAEHFAGYEGENDIVEYNSYNKEIQVSYKKQHNNHLSHICGFITGYMRLNVMEQLLNMEIDNVLKVVVDGIYYKGDAKLYNCFTPESKTHITRNSDSGSYISNYDCNLKIEFADFREHYNTELHQGVGGSGKTHLNIYDKGLLRKLYVAPSWKLSREKNRECGIDNQVWANLLSDDIEKTSYYKRRYSTLIIDEISMMTDTAKQKIFDTYKDCKIIFCGDPNYQLPQFQKDEECISLTGFDNVVTYTENRRCKCKKLLEILTLCREQIDNPNLFNIVKKLIPSITQEELKNQYTIKDLILTRSVMKRDFYTELLTDSKKYYVLNTDRNFCKGEILYEKPNDDYKEGVDYEIRNAYTIHSIQGETAKNKLYIHDSYMESTAIYTALSRAEYLHQINLIIE